VIACTDDDLVNLEIALDVRAINPKIRLVMRFFDQNMAQKLGKAFHVDSTFSTSALAAPLFAAAALDEQVLGAYRLGDTVMVSVQIDVHPGSPMVGKTLLDAEQLLDAPIVGMRREAAAHPQVLAQRVAAPRRRAHLPRRRRGDRRRQTPRRPRGRRLIG
jgi:Trk K+ transport system NAD-binding subunit